jgi:hypothetical protein
MAQTPEAASLITKMLTILQAVGIPLEHLTKRRAEKVAMAMLAVADVAPHSDWTDAKGFDERHRMGTKDIIKFRNQHFGENESLGSYDDVKRKDLLLPEQAYLVLPVSPIFAYVATNVPTRKYTLEATFAALLRTYGTPGWSEALDTFKAARPSLAEEWQRKRGLERVPITLPNGEALPPFEPGEHNQLQKSIIEDFLPIYVPHARILYVGDASNKSLYRLDDELTNLGFAALAHEDLPDILAHDPIRNWIFVIEAVHSYGVISEARIDEIKRLMVGCTQPVVYVTAFLTRKAFQTWAAQIAWETEVWIAANPEHLIHFNGDKFLGPYKPGLQSSIRS